MTKQEVHKWVNERADMHLENNSKNSNVDITTQRIVAKLTALEELIADLIEKHF